MKAVTLMDIIALRPFLLQTETVVSQSKPGMSLESQILPHYWVRAGTVAMHDYIHIGQVSLSPTVHTYSFFSMPSRKG